MTQGSNNERLARLETTVEHILHQSEKNGTRAEEIFNLLLDKVDNLDSKLEQRFNKIEDHAYQDAKELASLKSKGAGFLAAIGAVFTFTATAFSDFFSSLKTYILG